MDLPQFCSKGFDRNPNTYLLPNTTGRLHTNHSKDLIRAALQNFICEIDSKNKNRTRRAAQFSYLIYELKFLEAAELSEISAALGQSKTTTRAQLKQLVFLDLIKRVEIDGHILYALNGHYNYLIDKILDDFHI